MKTSPRASWAIAVASLGYVGFFPVAPGSLASAIAAGLYYRVDLLHHNVVLALSCVFFLVVGIKAVASVLEATGESDPSFVVIDELVGQWVALFSLAHQGEGMFVVISLLFFRIFDIAKPYPVMVVQRGKSAVHVILDDLLAGIYANLFAHLCLWGISFYWER